MDSLFTCGAASRSRRGESPPPGEKSRTEYFKHQPTQRKDVWNEILEFFMSSAVCLLSADCLLFQKHSDTALLLIGMNDENFL